MPKPNILQIITGLDYGGAEKVVYDLCSGLIEKGYDVRLVSLSEKKAMLPEFEKRGISVISLGINKNPKSVLNAFFRLQKLIRKEKTDLIHAHMTHAMLMAAALRIIFWRIPLVFTPHNIRFGSKSRVWIIGLLKFFRSVDILFSKEHDRPFFKKRISIIPNGIKVTVTENKLEKSSIFTFLTVGRLEVMKNHIALIPIAKELKEKYKFRIQIAGEGPLKSMIKEEIEKEKLEDTVQLLGFRKDIDTLNRQSHVFIMPSKWEGLPIALLEAGLARLPVITTPVGSIPTLIDESTGYPGSVEEFPRLMVQCIENYASACEKGKRLYNRIKKDFSIERFIKQHEELYQKLLG